MDIEIINRGRGPEIKGTRITVYDVYHYVEDGTWSELEIAEALRLTPEQVHLALAFIDKHKEEISKIHRQIEDRISRGNSPEIEKKLETSRKKRQSLLDQIRQTKHEANGAGNSR